MPRQKQNNMTSSQEFIDKDHAVADRYYDLLELEYDIEDMCALVKRDPDFYDPYLCAAGGLRETDREVEARKLEDEAFVRAISRIADKFGNWPKLLAWGFFENRHIIRALATGADNLWKDGKIDEALEIYRKLFRTNLNDNIGARYSIIGIRLGLTYNKFKNRVWPQSAMPAEHIDSWFRENAPKFPDEFKEWERYCEKELGIKKMELY